MDLSSDSSDSDRDDQEIVEAASKELTLNQVNDMVREYEKMEKRERKIRVDSFKAKEQMAVTADQLANITLTKKQIKQLEGKEKKERTEKQKESARKLLDLRKDKTKDAVILKVAPPRVRRAKIVEEPEEQEEEIEPVSKTKSFQARKPALDIEEDVVDQKVEKLSKLNSVLASNPFYAQVLASRGVKF
jgi:type IV secretory pathway VirD2 relaxase